MRWVRWACLVGAVCGTVSLATAKPAAAPGLAKLAGALAAQAGRVAGLTMHAPLADMLEQESRKVLDAARPVAAACGTCYTDLTPFFPGGAAPTLLGTRTAGAVQAYNGLHDLQLELAALVTDLQEAQPGQPKARPAAPAEWLQDVVSLATKLQATATQLQAQATALSVLLGELATRSTNTVEIARCRALAVKLGQGSAPAAFRLPFEVRDFKSSIDAAKGPTFGLGANHGDATQYALDLSLHKAVDLAPVPDRPDRAIVLFGGALLANGSKTGANKLDGQFRWGANYHWKPHGYDAGWPWGTAIHGSTGSVGLEYKIYDIKAKQQAWWLTGSWTPIWSDLDGWHMMVAKLNNADWEHDQPHRYWYPTVMLNLGSYLHPTGKQAKTVLAEGGLDITAHYRPYWSKRLYFEVLNQLRGTNLATGGALKNFVQGTIGYKLSDLVRYSPELKLVAGTGNEPDKAYAKVNKVTFGLGMSF